MIYYPENKTQPKFKNGDIVLVKGCGIHYKVIGDIYSYINDEYEYYLSNYLWYTEKRLMFIEREGLKEEDMW